MPKTNDSLSSKRVSRLDESFSSRALQKNMSGRTDVEIDTSAITVSRTGNIGRRVSGTTEQTPTTRPGTAGVDNAAHGTRHTGTTGKKG